MSRYAKDGNPWKRDFAEGSGKVKSKVLRSWHVTRVATLSLGRIIGAHTRVAKLFNAKLANDRLSGRRGILVRCTALISSPGRLDFIYSIQGSRSASIGRSRKITEGRRRGGGSCGEYCGNVVRDKVLNLRLICDSIKDNGILTNKFRLKKFAKKSRSQRFNNTTFTRLWINQWEGKIISVRATIRDYKFFARS